jgi:phosphatidylglycerophosphate synthase
MPATPPGLLTLANALTLARAPLAALIWVAPREPGWLLGIIALAGLSDVLDGRLARAARRRRLARGQDPGNIEAAEAIGAWLDPLLDKLFVLSVLVAVGTSYPVSPIHLALIAAREITLLPLAAAYLVARARARRVVHLDFRAGKA